MDEFLFRLGISFVFTVIVFLIFAVVIGMIFLFILAISKFGLPITLLITITFITFLLGFLLAKELK